MENVLLVILLILALALIAVVLLQRSEGGGLGIGGGGGVMSARGAATALGKVTWGLGIAFLAVSLAMTVVSARSAADQSVIDRVDAPAPATGDAAPATPALPDVTDMMPGTDAPSGGAATPEAPAEIPAEAPAATPGDTPAAAPDTPAATPGDAPVAPPRAD